jgi:hypothetical protein
MFSNLQRVVHKRSKEVEIVSPMQRHSEIDVVAHDPKSDSAILGMTESRPWDEKREALLFDIQEKLNTYIAYVVQGQLVRDYPQLEKKKVEFRLFCSEAPPPDIVETLRSWKEEALTPRGITWTIRVLPAK